MKVRIKALITFILFAAASVTMLRALPHVDRARLMPPDPSASITIDPSFNAPFFAVPDVTRAVLLPGGKYVAFFNIDTIADQSASPVIRFNANGSLDTTFSFSSDYGQVTAVASASGGKLIVAATRAVYGVFFPDGPQDILRVNADGSIDPTFGPAQATNGGHVRGITVNGDGTIFVAGIFPKFNGQVRQGIVKLLPNGTVDPSFAAVSMSPPAIFNSGDGTFGVWTEPVVDANSKVLIAGDFSGVNGMAAPGVARLNSDGTLDTNFSASGFTLFGGTNNNFVRPIRGLAIQSDDKIIIGGRFVVASLNRVPLVRLNTDGSLDTNFAAFNGNTLPFGPVFGIKALVIQPDDKVIAVDNSVWRFDTDGSLDGTFHNPELLNNQDEDYAGEAFTISFTSGGGLFIGGTFSDIDDVGGPYVEHWGAAKLNADGTLDSSFTTSRRTGHKIEPSSFARGVDGSTLVGFNYYGFHPTYDTISHNFGRLLSTGAVDPSFDPIASFDPGGPLGPNFVCSGFISLPDGSSLITGFNPDQFTYAYGRLLPDYSEDQTYQADPSFSFSNALPRLDGKVIADGPTLLNSDGTIDSSFQLDPAITADTEQRDGMGHLIARYRSSSVLAPTANGTVLFAYLSRDGTVHLVRLTSTGSIDPSFPARTFPAALGFTFALVFDTQFNTTVFIPSFYTPDFPLKQAKALANGKTLLTGSFASYGGTPAHGIVQINSNGSIDSAFNVGGGAQWIQTPETGTFHPSVDAIDFARGGNVLLAGTFEAFNGTPVPGIINLNPDGSVDGSFIPPVERQLYDYQPAYLKRQADGSFLLSGPYSRAGQTNSPSFFHLQVMPDVGTPADLFASINRLNVQGSGAIFEFTPAGAQSTFASPLVQPRGMAFDSSGNLFVATTSQDSSQGIILKFDPTGAQTTFASVVGPAATFFLADLKIDNAGNIFVAAEIDQNLDPNAPTTIYKFTPSGTQSTFGFVPGLCIGIAFDSMGNLYASDAVFQKIYKFLPDGRSSVFVDTSAFGPDESPSGLTIDQFDNLFATVVTFDSMGNLGPGRILKVTPDGTQSTFATGLDNNPRGLAFDSTGNLFVAERPPTTTGDILEFDPNGIETIFASGLGRPQGNGGPVYVAFQPFPVIKGNPSASATNGSQFIYQIAATNHPASYAASGLPPGVNVDPASGIISGVPTVTGNFQVSISASNIFGTGPNSLDLTIQPAPAGPEIISSTTATGRTGEFFRFQVLTSGTTSSALLTTSELPPGLSANATTGLISGTTTANGTFSITLTITDGSQVATGMLQLTFTSDPAIPIITSGDTASLVPNMFFSYTLMADANGSFSYIGINGQVNGALPPNLMYDAPSHTISGIFMPTGKINRTYGRSARPIRPTFSIGQPDTLKIRPPGIGTCQTIVSNESGTGTNPLNFFEGYFVTVRTSSNRAGSVDGGYNGDLSVTLMATPNASYGFQKWINEDGSTASTSTSYTFTPTSDRTLTAIFIVTGPTPTPPPSSTPKPNPPPGPSATPRPSSTPK